MVEVVVLVLVVRVVLDVVFVVLVVTVMEVIVVVEVVRVIWHQAFLAADQPRTQWTNPTVQSYSVFVEVPVEVIVVVLEPVDVNVVVAVVEVHPKATSSQHQLFFSSDHPFSQLCLPTAQS